MAGKNGGKIIANLIFIIISICCVLPVFLILSASFSDNTLLWQQGYSLIPRGFSVAAFEYIFKVPKAILSAYRVTITVTVIGTAGSLFLTSALAYVISRQDYYLAKVLSFLVLFAMLFNVGMVPTYITMVKIYNLKDTLFALIFPYLIVPWNVFLMKSFLRETPVALIEAAKIDGAGEIQIFFRIVMPLAKPALATVGLFIAFMYWNDWYLSMLYVDSANLSSLQYYMYRLMNNITFLSQSMVSANVDLTQMPGETTRMALCVLAAGPMLIVFPFFQKYFVRGISVGAVKG